MSKFKLFSLFVLLTVSAGKVLGNHILTGEIQVHYVSDNTDTFTYQVQFISSRLCQSGSMIMPSTVDICGFNLDDNKFYAKATLSHMTSTPVYDCYGTCAELNIYSGYIKLYSNKNGYTLKLETCCRAEAVSLRNDQDGQPFIGSTYECFIKPEYKVHSASFYSRNHPIPNLMSSFVNNLYKLKIYPTSLSNLPIETSIIPPCYGASINNNYPSCDSIYRAPVSIHNTDFTVSYSANSPMGQGTLSYNTADSVLSILGKSPGIYVFTFQTKIYKDTVLICRKTHDMAYNVTSAQLPPSVTLSGTKTAFNAIKLDWINDCIKNNVAKTVMLKSTGNSGNFNPLSTFTSPTYSMNDQNLQLNTKLFYQVMVITDVQDTLYSNILETEMWYSGIQSVFDRQLELYPNPGDGLFNLNIADLDIRSIQIYSSNGQLIKDVETSQEADLLRIDLSTRNNGLYLVELTLADGTTWRARLVLQK